MDFFQVRERVTKNGAEVYANFIVRRPTDLMIRGGAFYAIWDEKAGVWSTNEYDVPRLVDAELYEYAEKLTASGIDVRVRTFDDYKSNSWPEFQRFTSSLPDSFVLLDSTLVFANTPPRKENYSSKHLPYSLEPGPITAYIRLMSFLFDPGERQKLEWAVGAVIAGDSKQIQKFIVMYGEAGTGKSTFLNILEKLFEGYWAVFDGRALTSQRNNFASESFKSNPLVAIQHDGDLSKIEDNTILSTIISHEPMVINEKYRSLYTSRINAFLFIGTNQSVRITDAKSGLIRRLIDVNPTGNRFPPAEYDQLVSQIGFELGAIAHHCLGVYRELGKNFYSAYRPTDMIIRTDIFYNFLMANFDMLRQRDGITLKEAWGLYKDYCAEAGFERKMNMHRFRDELRNYFSGFDTKKRVGDLELRSLFTGFKTQKLSFLTVPDPDSPTLIMEETESVIDKMMAGQPAQYANEDGTPLRKWAKVGSVLSDLDTSRLHFLKMPPSHIVIDFDLKGADGQKNRKMNLEAASRFPPTYAEFSQSGLGIHLHYIYEGDVSQLSHVYDDGIEVKTFTGDSSLRRRLTKCNNLPVEKISSGLPLKEKRLMNSDSVRSERALRNLIIRNVNKDIHPGTKPSIDFIYKILEDAWKSGMPYDVTDMRQRILAFANNSTHHGVYCVKRVMDMKFSSEDGGAPSSEPEPEEQRLVFFDVEVFPNLFVCGWKYDGDERVVKMINPSAAEMEKLPRLPLVGFNNRRYDNHIIYAAGMGYSNADLFKLSQRIVAGERTSFFGSAYDLSHADIYDFSSKKQSLKRWQIDLGLIHKELGLPWDKPVPEELWEQVADYCANDVITTEKVFHERYQDYVARRILADLSGYRINDITSRHTARIIFGDDRHPQDKFIYTDLSEQFPGYKYEAGVSTYKGEITGEGGYVYAEPGMYSGVSVLDVSSMHPASIKVLNLFGPYTKSFADLTSARLAIKHHDYAKARGMLGGALEPYLGSDGDAKALSDALKIVINQVYGLTSARFENPFRDIRNVDNIVAKRGALFMIDLKLMVQDQGFQVVHIKTDSIKITLADEFPYIVEQIIKFGDTYGYQFELEAEYEKFCLINDAVYIAKTKEGKWTATGAQFAHPYVFKTLFTKEAIEFSDYCETRSVTTALYLDFGDGDPHFIGRTGSFVPVGPGTGGGSLLRSKEGAFHAVGGTKGYLWREAAQVRELGLEDTIDLQYFRSLTDDAVTAISKHGDFEWFVS